MKRSQRIAELNKAEEEVNRRIKAGEQEAYQRWFLNKMKTVKGRYALEYRFARTVIRDHADEFNAQRIQQMIKTMLHNAKDNRRRGNVHLANKCKVDAAAWAALLHTHFCPHCKSRLSPIAANEFYTAGKLCHECGYTTAQPVIQFSDFLNARRTLKAMAVEYDTSYPAAAAYAWKRYNDYGVAFAAWVVKEERIKKAL